MEKKEKNIKMPPLLVFVKKKMGGFVCNACSFFLSGEIKKRGFKKKWAPNLFNLNAPRPRRPGAPLFSKQMGFALSCVGVIGG